MFVSLAAFTAAIALAPANPQSTAPPGLSFEQRVEAQRAIERVYWSHRIWPSENDKEKPPLEEVLSEKTLRARVARYLQLSSALQSVWNRPIGGDQLQAEMRRMADATRAPEFLHELFGALKNDPRLIAETLARPALAERLARNAYAADERFHGALRRRAEAALSKSIPLVGAGGEYREERWAKVEGCGDAKQPCLVLAGDEWQRMLDRLVSEGRILEEQGEGFRVIELLAREENEATVGVSSWRKVPFDSWWAAEEKSHGTQVVEAAQPFVLPNPASSCAPDTWQPTWTDVPDPRSWHSTVWTGTEMIVWGGAGPTNTGGRYDPATDTWRPTSTGGFSPSARESHTAVWTGTRMIVWGGDTGAEWLRTGAAYDPTSDSWSPLPMGPASLSARSGHTAVWTGTEMIVWGGGDGQACTSSGARYDPATQTWSEVSSAGPSARCWHTAVWTGSRMIVWGGGSPGPLNTGGTYDPATDRWVASSTGSGVPLPRSYHTAIWTGREMIVYGGLTPELEDRDTGARFEPTSNAWAPMAEERPRLGHTAIWTGTEMIVWGGTDLGGGRYDPDTDTWSETAFRFGNRGLHTAIWTGTEMIVWGGFTNTGARYSPQADSWMPTSTGSTVFIPRRRHTMVWTGAEMILWGGMSPAVGLLSTGVRYDPATDDWKPTAQPPDLERRYDHGAVWTGTEMIAWGGFGLHNVPNSGSRYDPTNDSWAVTSTGAGVPAGRVLPHVFWTGKEMLVWGGLVTSPRGVNTGGLYEPGEDVWRPTSTGSNVPLPGHFVAVWTGSEMIAWGVYQFRHDWPVEVTGGRFDPAMNSWTSLPNLWTMEPRVEATAVWTGEEMIVWGGRSLWNTPFATGDRYDPQKDEWRAIPIDETTPLPRYRHTAVWTGTEMIVWGGKNFSGELQSGGRYDPHARRWTATSTGPNTPSPRSNHAAVWTGTEMIVWGTDFGMSSTGGCYCGLPFLGGPDPGPVPRTAGRTLERMIFLRR